MLNKLDSVSGDSAKALAVSGLGVVGRDYYGVFPLKGKLLNTREATGKQITENAEINALLRIIGLQYKMKYDKDDDLKTLRYGKVMIMADQVCNSPLNVSAERQPRGAGRGRITHQRPRDQLYTPQLAAIIET